MSYQVYDRSLPLRTDVVLDGHGTAVHFGYYVMKSNDEKAGIDYTDVLDRYRAYAEENICPEVPAH